MITLKLIAVGDSIGIVFPPEVLEKLKAKEGDRLLVIQTKSGVEIRSYDSDLVRQMEIAEDVMDKNRDVLRRLAES